MSRFTQFRKMLPISAICAGMVCSVPNWSIARAPVDVADISSPSNNGGFVLNGINAGDEAGDSVTYVGDMNGDGISDIAIGAPGASPSGRTGAGEVYVVFGKASGTPVELSSAKAGTNGFVIIGSGANGGRIPRNLSGAGDVNGDGLDDLLISWTRVDLNSNTAFGFAHIVFGQKDTTPVDLAELEAGTSDKGFSYKTDSNSSITTAVPVGDFNGDGYADFAILDGVQITPRQAYIVFGREEPGIIEESDIKGGSGGVVVSLPKDNDRSLSGVGDVNGDGFDDVLIGLIPFTELSTDPEMPEYYVLFGRQGQDSIVLADAVQNNGGIKASVNAESSYAGTFAVGDVNGDGLDDFAVDMPYEYGVAPGHVVVFGRQTSAEINLQNVASGQGGGFALEPWWDQIQPIGDVNGDGLGDMAGAFSYYSEVAVITGKTDFTEVTSSAITNGSGSFYIIANEYDYNGSGISTAGDMNLDGLADILTGAPLADSGATETGAAYVIFSPNTAPATRQYKAAVKNANAPWRGVGMTTSAIQGTPFSQVWVSYQGGAATGVNNSSTVTVLPIGLGGILNLPDGVATTIWQLVDNRTGTASSSIRIRYRDEQISGLNEASLRLYHATAPTGPWTQLSNVQVDTKRNLISGSLAGSNGLGGYFAIAEYDGSGGVTAAEIVNQILQGPSPELSKYDINNDGVVDAADVTEYQMLSTQ